MIHQLFVKVFVLVFVINLQLIGLGTGQDRLHGVAFINLVGLFVVLFQHRADLTTMTPEGKRTLFAPGVFLGIAIAVGLRLYALTAQSFWERLSISPWIGSLFGAILFWVMSAQGLGMMKTASLGRKKTMQGLVGVLLLMALAWVGVQIQGVGERLAFGDADTQKVSGVVVENKELKVLEIPLIDGSELLVSENSDDDSTADDSVVIASETDEELPPIRYREALPLLVSNYAMKAKNGSQPSFTLLSKDSSLYEAFRIAYQYGMVGTNIDPDRLVGCDNAAVLRGLAEGWTVAGGSDLMQAYWDSAAQKGLVRGSCNTRQGTATKSFLLD